MSVANGSPAVCEYGSGMWPWRLEQAHAWQRGEEALPMKVSWWGRQNGVGEWEACQRQKEVATQCGQLAQNVIHFLVFQHTPFVSLDLQQVKRRPTGDWEVYGGGVPHAKPPYLSLSQKAACYSGGNYRTGFLVWLGMQYCT